MSVAAPSPRPVGLRLGRFAGLQYRGLLISASLTAVAILIAVVGPWITPYSPVNGTPGAQLLPPSAAHWFGTDGVGLDVFSRVVAATRTDLTVALLATLLAVCIGTPMGAAAGYYRTFWSELLMRVSDLIQSFPVFILAMITVVVLGHNIQGLIIVITMVNAPIYVRLMRAEILSLRERTFIEAAEALGLSGWRVIARHLVPNAMGPVFAQASITVGIAMLLTAGLSFVGAGVRVPTPEWGSMIAQGAPYIITGEWWGSVFPGVALSLTVFSFALLGDSLQILSDPTRRRP